MRALAELMGMWVWVCHNACLTCLGASPTSVLAGCALAGSLFDILWFERCIGERLRCSCMCCSIIRGKMSACVALGFHPSQSLLALHWLTWDSYHIVFLLWIELHSPGLVNLPVTWMYAASGNVNCRSPRSVLSVRALRLFLACWVRGHLLCV